MLLHREIRAVFLGAIFYCFVPSYVITYFHITITVLILLRVFDIYKKFQFLNGVFFFFLPNAVLFFSSKILSYFALYFLSQLYKSDVFSLKKKKKIFFPNFIRVIEELIPKDPNGHTVNGIRRLVNLRLDCKKYDFIKKNSPWKFCTLNSVSFSVPTACGPVSQYNRNPGQSYRGG